VFCPKCGQQQISDETRFCSRCGFLLTAVAEVVASSGHIPGLVPRSGRNSMSPKRRGLMQGLFIFLLSFLVVPLITMITIALNAEPIAVVMSAILLVVGGLLRAVYALMFESGEPGVPTLEENAIAASRNLFGNKPAASLPPKRSVPAIDYAAPTTGSWRDTNEHEPRPGSVVESTTRLLRKEAKDQ
jgi:hypothetical protein